MTEPSTYLHLTESLLIGYIGTEITTQISLNLNPVSTAVVAFQNRNGLGYEIAPDPADGGSITYRFDTTSTNTILSFNDGNAALRSQTLFISPYNGPGVTIMYPDPTTGDAFMAMNTGLGQTRIITKVDPTSKQGLIQFYSDDAGSAGTLIGTSTIRTQNLVVSTLSTLNAYVQNVRISTAIISTVAIQTGLISSLIYTSIVGPTILQVQTIAF